MANNRNANSTPASAVSEVELEKKAAELKAMEEKLKAMEAELEKKAADLEANSGKGDTETSKSPVKKEEKMVKIRLPLTRTEKDDEYVAVNGRTWQIKRGTDVEVPACVAEVLQHKEEMLASVMALEEKAAEKAGQ